MERCHIESLVLYALHVGSNGVLSITYTADVRTWEYEAARRSGAAASHTNWKRGYGRTRRKNIRRCCQATGRSGRSSTLLLADVDEQKLGDIAVSLPGVPDVSQAGPEQVMCLELCGRLVNTVCAWNAIEYVNPQDTRDAECGVANKAKPRERRNILIVRNDKVLNCRAL